MPMWRNFSDAPRKRAKAMLDWQAEVMQGAKRVAGRRLRPFIGIKQALWQQIITKYADVAELADARDLKSRGKKFPYRFDPGHRHHTKDSKLCVLSHFCGLEIAFIYGTIWCKSLVKRVVCLMLSSPRSAIMKRSRPIPAPHTGGKPYL